MAQVFLSYCRDDGDSMTEVKQVLIKAGASVWTDETIEPGTLVWQRAIESEISAASCVVVLLSPAAKESHWVRAEITRARFEEIDIVPVLVKGEREADIVPLGLENAQWIDIRRNRAGGLASLIDMISQIIGSAGVVEVATAAPQVSSSAVEGEVDDSYNWQAVGRVLQYYPRVNAAGVELNAPIRLGDLLFFGQGSDGVLQRIESIERNYEPIKRAKAGDQVGIRVWMAVDPGYGVEKAMNAQRALYVGTVARFYSDLSVIGIQLEGHLTTGDRIEVRGPGTRFVQIVRSIEVNRRRVNDAGAGTDIGLSVILAAKEGDRVYCYV